MPEAIANVGLEDAPRGERVQVTVVDDVVLDRYYDRALSRILLAEMNWAIFDGPAPIAHYNWL